MLGQIIDLLTKQEDDKKRILFLALKIFFTSIIAAKWYSNLFGNYTIVSITDSNAIIDFFIHGTAFVCFILFFLVWVVSYTFTAFVLMSFGAWVSSKIFVFILNIVSQRNVVKARVSKNKNLKEIVDFYIRVLSIFEVVEIENSKVKPSSVFYKLYDLLIAVENEETNIGHEEFVDSISLVFQFVFIYYLLNFHFLSSSIFLVLIVSIIAFLIVFFSFVAIVLSALVEFKHGRLLDLMEKLDSDYGTKKKQKTL